MSLRRRLLGKGALCTLFVPGALTSPFRSRSGRLSGFICRHLSSLFFFILFRCLLQSAKAYLFSFHQFLASLARTPGVGYPPTSRAVVSTSSILFADWPCVLAATSRGLR